MTEVLLLLRSLTQNIFFILYDSERIVLLWHAFSIHQTRWLPFGVGRHVTLLQKHFKGLVGGFTLVLNVILGFSVAHLLKMDVLLAGVVLFIMMEPVLSGFGGAVLRRQLYR